MQGCQMISIRIYIFRHIGKYGECRCMIETAVNMRAHSLYILCYLIAKCANLVDIAMNQLHRII